MQGAGTAKHAPGAKEHTIAQAPGQCTGTNILWAAQAARNLIRQIGSKWHSKTAGQSLDTRHQAQDGQELRIRLRNKDTEIPLEIVVHIPSNLPATALEDVKKHLATHIERLIPQVQGVSRHANHTSMEVVWQGVANEAKKAVEQVVAKYITTPGDGGRSRPEGMQRAIAPGLPKVAEVADQSVPRLGEHERHDENHLARQVRQAVDTEQGRNALAVSREQHRNNQINVRDKVDTRQYRDRGNEIVRPVRAMVPATLDATRERMDIAQPLRAEVLEQFKSATAGDSNVRIRGYDISRPVEAEFARARANRMQIKLELIREERVRPNIRLSLDEARQLEHYVRIMASHGEDPPIELLQRIQSGVVSQDDLNRVLTLAEAVEMGATPSKAGVPGRSQSPLPNTIARGHGSQTINNVLLELRQVQQRRDTLQDGKTITVPKKAQVHRLREPTWMSDPGRIEITMSRPVKTRSSGVLSSEIAVGHTLRTASSVPSGSYDPVVSRGEAGATGMLIATGSKVMTRTDGIASHSTPANHEVREQEPPSIHHMTGNNAPPSHVQSEDRKRGTLVRVTDVELQEGRSDWRADSSDLRPVNKDIHKTSGASLSRNQDQNSEEETVNHLPAREERPSDEFRGRLSLAAALRTETGERMTQRTFSPSGLERPDDYREIRENLVRTVSEQIQQARTKTQIVVDLHPRELGRIRITVRELGGNQLDIRIVTQHNATRELIDEQSDAIRLQLQKADIDVKQLTVENSRSSTEPSDTGQRQEDYFGNDSHHPQDNSNEPDERRRSWIWEWWWLQNRWRQ